MMTLDELLKRFESATDDERKRVLDMLPGIIPPLTPELAELGRVLWETAMRAVFES
jgi:hypothetical protein